MRSMASVLSLSTALLFVSFSAFAGDKDKDGISNKVDECKAEPEDEDGFEDEDGCPDPDNDDDGLLDGDDKCATDAEDKDGFEDEDGCPDPDNDEDGVLDADDKCAHESEDGKGDPDGCPDVDYALVADTGYLAEVTALTNVILEASKKEAEGCDDAAKGSEEWLAKNDITKLEEMFEARLARAGEIVPVDAVRKVAESKGSIYPALRGAVTIYCKDHAGWQKAEPKVDAVFAKWMTTEE